MRPYLILAHDYRRTSAGVRVLHRLCHLLNEFGCEAWVTPSVVNPEWTEHIADEGLVSDIAAEGIVIYPEVENGNPLQARRVVRYLLNIPNRIRPATHLPGEMVWCYCGLLRDWVPSDDRILFVPVVDKSTFRQGGNGPSRSGPVLAWIGKGAGTEPIAETRNALEITLDWPATADEVAWLFQTSRVFYSYANYTAMIIESRLCGCPTVVIPNGLWTREQFAAGTPGGMAGLAWGVALQELQWAWRTVKGFEYDYAEQVRQFDDQLARFVRDTQEWDND